MSDRSPRTGPIPGAPRAVPMGLLPHLRRARDEIDRRFAEPLGLAALASVAHVSPHHFVRSFKQVYGETPMRYLTRRRIERAQDLLRAANLTVTEICLLVGYRSLGTFSRRFRELTGESPSDYRDRWGRTGQAHVPGCYLFMRGVYELDLGRRGAIPEKPGPPAGRSVGS